MFNLTILNIALQNPTTSNISALAACLLDEGIVTVNIMNAGDGNMHQVKLVGIDERPIIAKWLSPADITFRMVMSYIFTQNAGEVEKYLVRNFNVSERKAHHFTQSLDYQIVEEWNSRREEIKKFNELMLAMHSARVQIDRCVPRVAKTVDISSYTWSVPNDIMETVQSWLDSHDKKEK